MLGPLSLFSSMLLETSFAAYNILCQVRFFPTIWFKAPSVHLTDLLQIWGGGRATAFAHIESNFAELESLVRSSN